MIGVFLVAAIVCVAVGWNCEPAFLVLGAVFAALALVETLRPPSRRVRP